MMTDNLPGWLKRDPDCNDLVIGTNGHRYPSRYYPGQGSANMDAAWEILDTLKPDAIDLSVRSMLAGLITAYLQRAQRGELG
jgi:hypothetical protein